MIYWTPSWHFRKLAELCWPDDVKLADSYRRPKGQSAAIRRLQRREEGYQALEQMLTMRAAVDARIRRLQELAK